MVPTPSEAHALLAKSDPAANAQLKAPPNVVTAYFTESLDSNLSSLRVVDGSGTRVDDGKLVFGPEPDHMAIGINGNLEPGYYTVLWQSLSSADGHLFKGFYPFTVLNPDGSQPSGHPFEGAASGGVTARPDTVTVRWSRIIWAAALLGSLAFFLWVVVPSLGEIEEPWRKRWRDAARSRALRVALTSGVALAIVGVFELYLQADQLGGTRYLDDVLRNDWGQRWIQRQIVLAGIGTSLGAALLLARRGRDVFAVGAMWVGLVCALAYVLLLALTSHADAVVGSFWAVGSDFLHMVAASVWIGALLQLTLALIWLRQEMPKDAKSQIQIGCFPRFAAIAATSVTVLLATGLANAVTQISDWSSLVDTAYGRALLVKLGIMGALLLVAGVNALYLRPRIEDASFEGDPADALRRRMSIAVRAELLLGVAVLCAAAILVLYPTSRVVRDAEAFEKASTSAIVGYEQLQPANDLIIDFTASPNTAGQNSFRVFLFPQQASGVGDVLKVRLKFRYQAEDLGVSQIDMEPGGLNAYKAVGPYLSRSGQWTVDVTVRRRGADDATASFPVPVAALGAGTGQFRYPLTVGSWLSVAAASLSVIVLLLAIWISGWQGLPEFALRFVRVGTALVSVLGVGVVVITLIPNTSNSTGNPIKATTESISIGQQLYVQNCASCHGQNGRGDGQQAQTLAVKPADLRVHVPYHQDQFFFNAIKGGLGPIMPAWSDTLTDEQIWNIINFLHSEFGQDAQQSSTQ